MQTNRSNIKKDKNIFFCIDEKSFDNMFPDVLTMRKTYASTENAIRKNYPSIATTSMAHFSFSLHDLGYNIFLCYKDKRIEIKEHMDLAGIGEPCKDIRYGHNLSRLFTGHVFDELLDIDYEDKICK